MPTGLAPAARGLHDTGVDGDEVLLDDAADRERRRHGEREGGRASVSGDGRSRSAVRTKRAAASERGAENTS
jgi:hypothetical protein